MKKGNFVLKNFVLAFSCLLAFCNLVTGFVSWVSGSLWIFFQKSFEVFVHLSFICVSFLGFRLSTLGRLRV